MTTIGYVKEMLGNIIEMLNNLPSSYSASITI